MNLSSNIIKTLIKSLNSCIKLPIKKIVRVLTLFLLLFNYWSNLYSSSITFNEQGYNLQATTLLNKFGLNNTKFIIKKNNKEIAANSLTIDSKGIHISIVANRNYCEKFNAKEREFILCHEISHIKRRHPTFAILSEISKNILFFLISLIMITTLDYRNYKVLNKLPFKLLTYFLMVGIVRLSILAINAKLSRLLEYQADNDALIMTKDLDNGI